VLGLMLLELAQASADEEASVEPGGGDAAGTSRDGV